MTDGFVRAEGKEESGGVALRKTEIETLYYKTEILQYQRLEFASQK